ncbi:MAG: hypothetical protein AVDCRST_MAG64-1778 [uncultured Phycisphaerae bacterium]|uniref:Uncharacterized protein n=1 Tax=uncultured Phycisphaerae bacterium TaxID=904963 RepID=A0A6J4P4H5_9BACT|nr:MAG: hypothetical protein AVDCRST_MAG64-1778 [uncultured Phycisphaerae bacterium]
MSTKWTVIFSVLWVLVVMVGCISFILYQVETRAWPRYQADERAAAMGGPAGVITAVTLAPLWIYWAVKRRDARAR